jgi:ATP-dependent DNA helicase RecG
MKLKKSENFELVKSTDELKTAIISTVAMLNKSKRASLCFGVTNKGKIVGQKISKKILAKISNTIKKGIKPRIFPHIKETYFGKKSCIQLEFLGENAPYKAFGKTYIRVNVENLETSPSNVKSIIEQKKKEGCECEE